MSGPPFFLKETMSDQLDQETLDHINASRGAIEESYTKKNAPAGTDKNVNQSTQNAAPPSADAPPKATKPVGGMSNDAWRKRMDTVNKRVEDAKPFNVPVLTKP